MTGFINGTSYKFYAWATSEEGTTDEKTVMLSDAIPAIVYTLSLTINSPTNTVYTITSITVSLSTSGNATLGMVWFNVKNGTTWVYAQNQTYTGLIIKTGYINGNQYTLYAWANSTEGTADEKTVEFDVQYILEKAKKDNRQR
jgi:hypothetical protein